MMSLEERLTNCISAVDVLMAKSDGVTTAATLKRVRDVLVDAKKALEPTTEETKEVA